MNTGIVVRTDNTFDRIELGNDPMSLIHECIGTKNVDVLTIRGFDVWTEDTADMWERRWVYGPPMIVNTLATSLCIHLLPHGQHNPLYGTAIVTGRLIDEQNESVQPDGLSWWDVLHISRVLGLYRQLHGATA